MAYKWVAPRISSSEVRGAILTLPGSPELVAIIRAFLCDLTVPEYWEEIVGYTVSPTEAAALGAIVLESFESSLF